MSKVLLPPQSSNNVLNAQTIKLFLAGSINMGAATNWQREIIQELNGTKADLVIYNPRRLDWNSDWTQDITSPQFSQQVNWELDNLERADIIFFYFDAKGMSPISLLELGNFGPRKDKNIIVYVHPDYERKGNVDIFCNRHDIKVYDVYTEVLKELKTAIKTKGWKINN